MVSNESGPARIGTTSSVAEVTDRMLGRRVLVTSCDTYMGPPIVELFRAEGADVVADPGALLGPAEPADLAARAGGIDVLVANLDRPTYSARVGDIDDDEWLAGFEAMVHPLMRPVRAVAPQTIERRAGSIVALTSSAPLRRTRPHAISYVAARAAQNELALFLASDASSFVYGQVISNDGGWS